MHTGDGGSSTSAQLSTICGVLIESLYQGSVYYIVSWTLRKSKSSVRSTAAGELLAAGKEIDEDIILIGTYLLLLGLTVHSIVRETQTIFTLLHRRSVS